MKFLEPGNFNGLIFRDGMVFISEIDKWVTQKEYEKYIDVYTDSSLELIARSEPHKQAIENAFNRKVNHVVSDFNIDKILEILE